jgi:uncharacterized protein YkwD
LLKDKKKYFPLFFAAFFLMLTISLSSNTLSGRALDLRSQAFSPKALKIEEAEVPKDTIVISQVNSNKETAPLATAIPDASPTVTITPSISVTPTLISSPTQKATLKPTMQKVLGITSAPIKTSTPKPSVQIIQDFTDKVFDLVNNERASRNLPRLIKNNFLTISAKSYANHLASNDFLSHTGKDGSTMVSRNTAAGYANYKFMAENIASGQTTPELVFQGWMNSQGHRENILNINAKEIGIGYTYNASSKYKHFWVQEFGAR